MAIKIITGKGGVGKTSSALLYGLTQALNGNEIKYVSIDVLNTPADALGIHRKFFEDPFKENTYQNLWDFSPWKTYKKELTKKPGNLLIKTLNPTGKQVHEIKNAIIKGLYSEYEVNAGNEILKKGKETLIIDTDSLEGLEKLLNYASDNPKVGKKILTEGEIIPVTTLEKASMEKLNNILFEKLITSYQPMLKTLIINHALPNDIRLDEIQYYINLSNAEKIILYEQASEPLGIKLLNLITPQDIPKKEKITYDTQKMPEQKIIMPFAKGGQGKTTIACALAVRLAEQGFMVYLMSADSRNSIPITLNEKINEFNPEQPWHDLSTTEQYKRLNIKVLKENTYYSSIPGFTLTKAMKKISELEDNAYLIIDTPPIGNFVKNTDSSLPNEDFIQELIFKLDLLRLKNKNNGAYDYFSEKRNIFNQALQVMQTPNFYALPVMQPTKTALLETNNIISKLYYYNTYPYNVFMEDKYYLLNEGGKKYDFRKHVIINKANNQEIIKDIQEEFPKEDYDLTFIPEQEKEPIGRTALSKIGKILM